jgi:hypothetical protein
MQQFTPKVKITGKWISTSSDDSFHLVTRSDGVPVKGQLLVVKLLKVRREVWTLPNWIGVLWSQGTIRGYQSRRR